MRQARWLVRTSAAWAVLVMFASLARGQVVDLVERYPSDGKPVPIECFAPAFPGMFPATILPHGSLDRSTPASDVKRYQEPLAELEIHLAVHIDKGSGHHFSGAAFADAAGHAARFFDRHLMTVPELVIEPDPRRKAPSANPVPSDPAAAAMKRAALEKPPIPLLETRPRP